MHEFGLAQQRDGLHQPRRRVAHHDAARRRHRLHALRHSDLFTNGGVAHWTRTDLAGDHLTGIQSDSQL
jgi:hypothetical protein